MHALASTVNDEGDEPVPSCKDLNNITAAVRIAIFRTYPVARVL